MKIARFLSPRSVSPGEREREGELKDLGGEEDEEFCSLCLGAFFRRFFYRLAKKIRRSGTGDAIVRERECLILIPVKDLKFHLGFLIEFPMIIAIKNLNVNQVGHKIMLESKLYLHEC